MDCKYVKETKGLLEISSPRLFIKQLQIIL